MISKNGSRFRALRFPALSQVTLCLALFAGCSSSGGNGAGGGGASSAGGSASGSASSTGGSASSGASSTGGSSRAGASSAGGSEKGGTSSAGGSSGGGSSSTGGSGKGSASSTGVAGSGGSSSTDVSGSGGTSSSGGSGGSGATSTGGPGSGGKSTGSGGTSTVPTAGTAGSTSTGSGGTSGGGSTGTGGGTSAAALPSKGCGKTSTLTFGTVPNEKANGTPGTEAQGTGKGGWVTMGGRGFALRLPDDYDNNHPYWLIFGFHGNGMNAASVDTGGANGYFTAYWGLQKQSKNGAFFVAPEWSGGGWGTGDFTYTDDMVKTISENYCIDMSNIITSGFSFGGGMSHALACNRASTNTNSVGYKFRAAVLMEACSFLVQGTCPNRDPISIWQMAGQTDGVCGFDDSKTVRNWFTDRDGCTGWTSESGNVAASKTGTVSQEPTEPPRPGKYTNPGGHVCSNYTCSNGAVRWCANQSGHGTAVVDGTDSLYDECANRTSQYPQGNCSPGCPCTWTPADIWTWLNDPSANKYTPNATSN